MNPLKLEWTIVGAAIVLSLFAGTYRGREARAGDTLVVDFSLVPSDRGNLACAAPPFNKDMACSHQTPDGPKSPRGNVVPAVSTSRDLFLVKDLFSSPELIKKLTAHRDGNRRFVTRCELRLVARIANARVQFERRGSWGPANKPWLGEALNCR